MPWGRGHVFAVAHDQLASTQTLQRRLDGALGKAGPIRERAQTCSDWFPSSARGLAVKVKINQISGGLLIVPNKVAHQNIENVVIDGNGLFEAGHS